MYTPFKNCFKYCSKCNQLEIMVIRRLSFEERKFILKCYLSFTRLVPIDRVQRSQRSPRKLVQKLVPEAGISKDSFNRILKWIPRKRFILTLVYTLHENNINGGVQFCEWYLPKYLEDQPFY